MLINIFGEIKVYWLFNEYIEIKTIVKATMRTTHSVNSICYFCRLTVPIDSKGISSISIAFD